MNDSSKLLFCSNPKRVLKLEVFYFIFKVNGREKKTSSVMTDERMMRCAHIHISKRRNRRFLCYPYCARAPPPPAAVTKGSYNNEKLTFRFGFAPEPFFLTRGRFFYFIFCLRSELWWW